VVRHARVGQKTSNVDWAELPDLEGVSRKLSQSSWFVHNHLLHENPKPSHSLPFSLPSLSPVTHTEAIPSFFCHFWWCTSQHRKCSLW
jgi:hypothetical protein